MMKQINNSLLVFCETLKDPIGIDNRRPRFSWRPESPHALAPQITYRVCVFSDKEQVWDSGVVEDKTSIGVQYGGRALESFTEYRFEVTCTLSDGSTYVGEGRFEMAILEREEWQGNYLCHPHYEKRSSPLFVMRPVICGKVKKCRAYFSGLGYGELQINGKKADDSLLDPGWTDYHFRVLYRTLDLTKLIREGENHLRVTLGDGWMAHNHRYFVNSRKPSLPWYHEPCFRLNLRVEYEDGRVETFVPDEENCLANFSEIRSQNLFDGEICDGGRALELARIESGELLPSNGWVWPRNCEMEGEISAQVMPPIKCTEIISPTSIVSLDPSTYTVDMGINFSGGVRIRVRGEKGSVVKLRHAEAVKEDGRVDQENLRYAEACDSYILSGVGEETYAPRFTYHGFRFVELKLEGAVKVLSVEGLRYHSAVERIGSFSCDDPMLNRIYSMLINTEMNNLHSLPTDCPQRDERLAWLNDAMMRLEQNVMNFDSQLFFEKWLCDMRDTQKKFGTGAVPDTCPYYYGMNPARWNSSVFVALPYAIYLYYGDMIPIKEHWESLLWFMEFQKSKLTDEGLIHPHYVGEWCPPMKDSILEDKQSAFAKEISNQLATSCFYYLDCCICRRMASLLGKDAEAEDFANRAEQVKEAINRKYFSEEQMAYLPLCQGNQILPLYLGIVPEEYDTAVGESLEGCIVEKDNYHISTGSHTTRFLFETLTRLGKTDLAVEMLRVKSYPSFGYMLENGATSLWERWEKTFGFMTSYNHPMSGGFGVWFFKSLGGIKVDPDAPDRLLFHPHIPEKLNTVTCKRAFRSGEAISSWYRVGDELHYDVTVPWNMTAEITLDCRGKSLRQIEVNGTPVTESSVSYSFEKGRLQIEGQAGYLHIRVK